MGDRKEPNKTTDDVILSPDANKKSPIRRAQTLTTWQRVKSIGSDMELSPEAENEFKLKLQKARQRASAFEGPTALFPGSPSSPSPTSKKVEPKPLVTPSAVKVEPPKETPKAEPPKEPKKEEVTIKEEPKKEEPVKEEPKKEELAKEEPKKEEPTKEEPKKEEPKKEEPKKEEPKKEEPKKQEPKKFEPPKQEPKKFEPKKEEFKKFEPVKVEPVKKDIVSPKSPVDEPKKRVQYGVQFQGFQAIANPIQTRTFGVAKSNANADKNSYNQPWQRTSTIADFRVESIQKRESTLKKRDSFIGGSAFQGVVAGDPLAGLEAKRKLSQSIQSKKSSIPLSPTGINKEESELAKRFAEKQRQSITPTSTPVTVTATTTTTTPAKNTFKRLP